MPDRRMLAAAILAAGAAVQAFTGTPATRTAFTASLWLRTTDEPELHSPGQGTFLQVALIGAYDRITQVPDHGNFFCLRDRLQQQLQPLSGQAGKGRFARGREVGGGAVPAGRHAKPALGRRRGSARGH